MAQSQLSISLRHTVLQSERHAHTIRGSNLALCLPGGHVAWRADTMPESNEARKEMLAVVTGYKIPKIT